MPATRFEHLVQINDPLQPLLTEVSRAQMWRGLVRRAERPAEFVLGLAGAGRLRRRAVAQTIRGTPLWRRIVDHRQFPQ